MDASEVVQKGTRLGREERRRRDGDEASVRRLSSTISIECEGIRMKAGRKRGFT